MKIKALYTDWNQPGRLARGLYGGCGYYRVVKPMEYIGKTRGWDTEYFGKYAVGKSSEEMWTKFFHDIDLAVVRQMDTEVALSQIFGAANYFRVPVVVDVDDDFINVPKHNPASSEYYEGSWKQYVLMQAIASADGVTVTTPKLKEVYEPYNKNITVLPNCNDYKDWAVGVDWTRNEHDGDEIRFTYAGSKTHDRDLRLILPALKKIFKEYPQAKLWMAGNCPEFLEEELGRGRVEIAGGTPGWEGYSELMYSLNADIALAPLERNEFNAAKSHIKWMEYTMHGYPVAASNFGEYAKYIDDGETGLLVDNKDWYKKLKWMIENKDKRKKLADHAYEHIKQNLQIGQHIPKWRAFYRKVIKGGRDIT